MRKRFLLYGNSILLSGLAARMQTRTDLTVRCQPAQCKSVSLRHVDTVIVDVNELLLEVVMAAVKPDSNIRIIGLDDRQGRVIVLSRQVFQTRTLEDVLKYL